VSIQSKLTQYLTSERLSNFKNSLVGPLIHYGAWFTGLDCAEAARWVTVVPRHPKFKFDNSQYETIMRVRLFLPIRKLIEGTICACNQTPKVRVDVTGHHLITGCGMHGTRHEQHDMMVLELTHMAGYCGFLTRREPVGCFHTTEPSDEKRPDLAILNPQVSELLPELDGSNSKLILDVQITSPIPGSQSGVFRAMTPGVSRTANHEANKAYNSKNRKYKRLALENGLSFLPIIFETTGRPHPTVVKFVRSMAEDCEEVKKISKDIIYGYVMNSLSCVLQRGIANAINVRVSTLNGRQTRSANRGYGTSREFVSTHQEFCARTRK
jgi:hypothetical protein